jgi:thioredoxin-dependent peroxiredoxin
MKKILLLISLIFVASCSNTSIQNETKIEPTTSNSWELVESSTWNIKVDLTKSYHYLDSLNLKFDEKTFWDLIKDNNYTIVYFYPLDFTPNCTIQAIDFSAMLDDFSKLWYWIIWVSKNDIESHKKFAETNNLKIRLIQDKNSDLLKEFGALWEPKTYWNGDATTQIIRSTFIIDKNGNPVYAFRDVEALWHAKRIYEFLKNKK